MHAALFLLPLHLRRLPVAEVRERARRLQPERLLRLRRIQAGETDAVVLARGIGDRDRIAVDDGDYRARDRLAGGGAGGEREEKS
ncbi:hypothetical protein D3C83_35700 [compost metagenome]